MRNGWKTQTLSEIAEIIMGQSPMGSYTNKEGKGIPLLNGPTEFGYSHPAPTQFTNQPKKLSVQGDLLFCVRGSTTGRMNFSDQVYAIGRGLGAIRGKNSYSTRYVKYLIDFYLDRMLALCTGSTFPNLSRSDLENFLIRTPDPKQANDIAGVLSAIDDKIENNLAMNQTLEEMAMALYKHWFVDFGPFQDGEFVDSELGPIPKGWEVKGILEVADLLSGGTPKTRVSEYWGGNLNWVSAKDIGNEGTIYISETEKKISYLGLNNSSAKILPENTVIVVARGSVGKFGIISSPMAMNQSCYGLYSTSEFSQGTIYLIISNLIEEFKRKSYGSVFDTITTSTFKTTSVIYPQEKIIFYFNQIVDPLFKMIRSKVTENIMLSDLRDTLLPKLISGEVRLKEFREEVESAL